MNHLEQLESTSVHILREAYANFKELCMLWSIGKDSTVLLWLARKAFLGHVPFPLVHIDTGYKIPEMIEYRDKLTRRWHLNMIYGINTDALNKKQTFPDGNAGRIECCRILKTETLEHTLSGRWPRYRYNHSAKKYELDSNTEPFTGVIVGVRADEEGTRSKERYLCQGGRGRHEVEGALFLPPRQAKRLGYCRAAAGVLEPVQDRLCARHARSYSSSVRLDGAEYLGIHRA